MQVANIFKPLFLHKLKNFRILCYYGGRGGGKSVNISLFLILECLKKNIRIMVAREVDKSKINSIQSLFKRLIREYKFNDYVANISFNKISFVNGSEMLFVGVSEATIDNIRSADNISYFWFEECNNISGDIMRILIPSIRAENSQIILTLNPKSRDDYIYKTYIENADNKDYIKAIKVNYIDNPLFPATLERDRQRDFKTLPKELYLHIWEGNVLEINDFKVIDIEKIGFFDDSKKFNYSEVFLSADTAFSKREGADFSVIGCLGKFGNELHLLRVYRGHWDFNELLENAKNAYVWLAENYKSPSVFLIEKKASGISLTQELKRLTRYNIKEIIPKNDKFARVAEVLNEFEFLKLPANKNPLNSWVESYLTELKLFRGDLKHEHDDQVDMTCYALKYFKNNVVNWSEF